MDFKLLGSVLLIVGTSIGAGMLALPIVAAQLGFVGSVCMLIACWLLMTVSAFLLLEANLWMPLNSNLISMAKATIGPVGQLIAWVTYLLLLYSLLCAYIAGGSDLFHNLLLAVNLNIPLGMTAFIFTFIFGVVVYLGIRSVDYVNRGLMFVKLGAYFIVVCLLSSLINVPQLMQGDLANLTSKSVIFVTITSFGYANIIPSLRIYFAGDVKKLKQAIIIGSLIPLFCYILWDAVVMGVVPLDTLMVALQSKSSTSTMVNSLNAIVNTDSITFFIKLFTSICVVTSFLGISLSLTDFLADGLHLEKIGWSNLFIQCLTFLPALMVVLFYPDAFIKALEYAGIYCVVLLIILPAWMVWRGRYNCHFPATFRIVGGKGVLIAMFLVGSLLIIRGLT